MPTTIMSLDELRQIASSENGTGDTDTKSSRRTFWHVACSRDTDRRNNRPDCEN